MDARNSSFEQKLKLKKEMNMCGNACQNPQTPNVTVLVQGKNTVTIKPFATLDDAFESANKISRLVYPEFASEEANDNKYIGDLLRAVSTLGAAKPEERYSALVNVLGLTIMGFDADDLPEIKENLNENLAKKAQDHVNEHTKTFLKDSGFTQDLKG